MSPLNEKVHHFRDNGSSSLPCWLLEKSYPMHFDRSEWFRVKTWGAASSVQWTLSAFALAEATLPNLSALAVARRSRCESLLFSWRQLFFPLFFVIFFSTDESPFGILENRCFLGGRGLLVLVTPNTSKLWITCSAGNLNLAPTIRLQTRCNNTRYSLVLFV